MTLWITPAPVLASPGPCPSPAPLPIIPTLSRFPKPAKRAATRVWFCPATFRRPSAAQTRGPSQRGVHPECKGACW